MSEMPERYRPDAKLSKHELYEMYWGDDLLSLVEVADETDYSYGTVIEWMDEYGIPRRVAGFNRDSSLSAFAGFYRDSATRTDEQSRTVDKTRDTTDPRQYQWQKNARRMDEVGDRAIIDSE